MNPFQFKNIQGNIIDLPPGKIICIGRNYVEHIQELKNEVPTEAVLFIKPTTTFQDISNVIHIPLNKGPVHHELELAILISKPLTTANEQQSIDAIAGYALALDLTLRELQSELKNKGLPWERAKSFDGSCPITSFIESPGNNSTHHIELKINGESRQQTNTDKMIYSIPKLISEISHWFSLQPGDVVLTGTPAGVAELHIKDNLQLILDNQHTWSSEIHAR